jgi:hypothetical protein
MERVLRHRAGKVQAGCAGKVQVSVMDSAEETGWEVGISRPALTAAVAEQISQQWNLFQVEGPSSWLQHLLPGVTGRVVALVSVLVAAAVATLAAPPPYLVAVHTA